MELRHLRYFVAVAEEQNVTRAAARLHVSQPPLTRQIHDLEDELGVALFSRTGKALRLTDAGRVFLEETRTVFARLDQSIVAAKAAAGQGGELHIGYAPSPAASLLPAALHSFQRANPAARVTLHDLTTPEMLAGLRDGSLHLALMMQPPKAAMKGVVFVPLGSFDIVVAVPPGHPFARRRAVGISTILKEPLVAFSRKEYPDYHAMLARVVGKAVARVNFAQECDSGMSLLAAVEAGKGVAITISALAKTAAGRVRFVHPKPALPHAIVGAAYPSGPLAPLAKAFLEATPSSMANGAG